MEVSSVSIRCSTKTKVFLKASRWSIQHSTKTLMSLRKLSNPGSSNRGRKRVYQERKLISKWMKTNVKLHGCWQKTPIHSMAMRLMLAHRSMILQTRMFRVWELDHRMSKNSSDSIVMIVKFSSRTRWSKVS